MAIPTIKVAGKRGSWFADADGEPIPCVHEYWTHSIGGKLIYDDPNYNVAEANKWSDLLVGLRTKRLAILTEDQTKDGGKNFERTGYIGLFTIGDIDTSGGSLRFQFLKRVANISN